MKILFFIGGFLVYLLTATPIRAETADDFLKAYFLIQDGDTAAKGGEGAKAIEKYSAALKIIQEIKRTAPDWNPNIITYRTKYCTDHILAAGGKIEPETTPSPHETTPINSVPTGLVPAHIETTTPSEATSSALPPTVSLPISHGTSEQIAKLERDLQEAHSELRKIREEKSDLESRLKTAEEELKSASAPPDERVQALLKENNSLKQKLSETEKRLREMPSNSEEIASLRDDLTKAQASLETLKKENENLQATNDSLKNELEETRKQLKTATSGPATAIAPEVLQTLQKENALLRSIVDRQFQEDTRRMTARDALAQELNALASRNEAMHAQIEILQTPLTPLSEEELHLLKTPPATLRSNNDNPNKLSGVVTATHNESSSESSPKLSGDNAILATDAKMLFTKNDLEGAGAKYEQILQSDPNNLFALSNLGVIRFRQEKVDEAEKILRAALVVDPQDAFSISILGIIQYRQGKYDDAISSLTHAIAINSNNQETHNFLGITYSQKGYQEAAEKELLKAIELKPDYGDAHFNLAVVYASQIPPSIELARKHYKEALELGVTKDPELEKLLNK